MSDVVAEARDLAQNLLAHALPTRWQHVCAVAEKAEVLAKRLGLGDADSLTVTAAAWAHDIGYSPAIAKTGFHALDGARHLVELEFPKRVADLVANHSCALVEARLRNLECELAEFVDEETLTRDLLWHCDLTTGPIGQQFNFNQRLADIRSRYGPKHLVTRVWAEAEPQARVVLGRVEQQSVQAAPETGQ